jgi:hypothetical protein
MAFVPLPPTLVPRRPQSLRESHSDYSRRGNPRRIPGLMPADGAMGDRNLVAARVADVGCLVSHSRDHLTSLAYLGTEMALSHRIEVRRLPGPVVVKGRCRAA